MSKPLLGGGGKATLPSAIIKPGKYKPKKFQMDMPDEKQSGIYGIRAPEEEDELVESMALDESARGPPLNQIASQSALGGAKV